MRWQRTTMGRLVYELGTSRGVVERIAGQAIWSVRVETPQQTYMSVFEYHTMHEAQRWVEAKVEALQRVPNRPSTG